MSELYKSIRNALESAIDKGQKHFIIYPFGEVGTKVKSILLDSYGIKPDYIVDNSLCNYNSDIKSGSVFDVIDCNRYTVIVSTTKVGIEKKLRRDLEKHFAEEQIVSILSDVDTEPCRNISYDYVINSIAWYTEYVIRADSGKNKYETKWINIRNKYKRIHIYTINVDAIGEILPRYFAFEEFKKENDELYVLLPSIEIGTKRVANSYAIQYLDISNPQESLFWLYVLENHKNEVEIDEIDRLRYRQKFGTYRYKAGSLSAHFNEKEEKIGLQIMSEMGLRSPYVCVSARNSEYNLKTLPSDVGDYDYSHRNADFYNYTDAIEKLGSVGIQTIKMGRFESRIRPIDNCIDYAGLYGDDFSDLYIYSRCKFALVGDSGICTIPMLFSKPVLMVNAIPISFGRGGFRYTEYDMYIPKKLYDKKKGRYLSLEEILAFESDIGIFNKCYIENGIEVVDNTKEEILEAVNEMLLRMENKWVDSAEDVEDQKRYHEIYKKMDAVQRSNKKNWIGGAIPYRLATSFIRRNKYLLS